MVWPASPALFVPIGILARWNGFSFFETVRKISKKVGRQIAELLDCYAVNLHGMEQANYHIYFFFSLSNTSLVLS